MINLNEAKSQKIKIIYNWLVKFNLVLENTIFHLNFKLHKVRQTVHELERTQTFLISQFAYLAKPKSNIFEILFLYNDDSFVTVRVLSQ